MTNKHDIKLSNAICLIIFLNILNATIKNIFAISGKLWDVLGYGILALSLLVFLTTINILFKRSLKIFIEFELIFAILYFINFLRYPTSILGYLQIFFWTNGICIPLGIIIYSIKDKSVIYNRLLKWSWVYIFMLSVLFTVNFTGYGLSAKSGKSVNYNMYLSYSMLLPFLFQMNQYMIDKKLKYLISCIIQVLIILLFGSRGALLAIAVFMLIKLIDIKKVKFENFISLIIYGGLSILSIVIVILKFSSVREFLLSIFLKSRTILLLFDKLLFYSSGRDTLYSKSLEMISEHPFIGWGISGWSSQSPGYPHSFILEIFIDYGIIIGSTVLITLGISFLIALYKSKGTNRNMIQIFFSLGFMPLMTSNTYVMYIYFWMFVFILISFYKEKNTVVKR